MHLLNIINHGFGQNVPQTSKRAKLNKIHEQFRTELKQVNQHWKWLLDINGY